MLVRGRVGVDEVMEESFDDAGLCAMTDRISAHVTPEIEATFPEHRRGRIVLTLKSGEQLDSGVVQATGGPDPQPTQSETIEKFKDFAGTVMDQDRISRIIDRTLGLTEPRSDFKAMMDLLILPVD